MLLRLDIRCFFISFPISRASASASSTRPARIHVSLFFRRSFAFISAVTKAVSRQLMVVTLQGKTDQTHSACHTKNSCNQNPLGLHVAEIGVAVNSETGRNGMKRTAKDRIGMKREETE
jgi:hypothetical protein